MISVVVPIYNSGKYLKRCLDSIVNQSYKDIEIILVDDCSSDDSRKICFEYLKKDFRIKLITNEINKGVAYCRNIGIKMATGKYISFVDSDDYVEIDYLEYLYSLIDGYDMSICNYFRNNNPSSFI